MLIDLNNSHCAVSLVYIMVRNNSKKYFGKEY